MQDSFPKGAVCYGGSPIEPYCCGKEMKDYIDIDLLEV